MRLNSFSSDSCSLLLLYFSISLGMPSDPHAFPDWRACSLPFSSLSVMGESNGFWLFLIISSKLFSFHRWRFVLIYSLEFLYRVVQNVLSIFLHLVWQVPHVLIYSYVYYFPKTGLCLWTFCVCCSFFILSVRL